ncbi:MAG TPA: hypothetical protein VI248_16095 [Kineosporiaceae bacterium]
MRLDPAEFDEVFGAVQEYGRLEYRAGVAPGREARAALREAYSALAGLKDLLTAHVAADAGLPDRSTDHRAAAREHVLANRELAAEPGDLARECLAWIASYRTDLEPEVYRECVLGVLDGYRRLSAPPNPWTTAEGVLPRQR